MHIFYQSLLAIVICFANLAFANTEESFIKADRIYYDNEQGIIRAEGNVRIKIDDYVLQAQSLEYNTKKDLVVAETGVKVTDNTNKKIHGSKVIFKDRLKRGVIEEFTAIFGEDSIIAAKTARRLSEDKFELERAIFTPCKVYCKRKPIWQIKSEKAVVDNEKQKITYRNSFFEVYGYPVVYIPYFMHATPNADAQSGFLYPSIKNKNFMIPLYLRLRNDIDFTLSPRFGRNYTIFDFEYRQLFHTGGYQIFGNFGNPSDHKLKTNQETNDTKTIHKNHRFHILAKGDFQTDQKLSFGFDVNIASDKSYLVNYHSIYDPYLTSSLYTRYIDQRNYTSFEAVGFQELRNDGSADKSFALPLMDTQHSFSLNDENSALFNVRTNSFLYNDSKQTSIAKSSLDFGVNYSDFLESGYMTEYSIANRFDIYWHDIEQEKNTNNSSKYFIRATPAISFKLGYPMIKDYRQSVVQIEPIIKFSLDKHFNSKKNKIETVDSYNTELSENNIFHSDKLNVVRSEQQGLQIGYGMNASLSYEDIYISSFLGQTYYNRTNINNQHFEYVGNISATINDNLNLFYRFRQDQNFKPIRNEADIMLHSSKIKTQVGFAQLRNIDKYFNNVVLPTNHISQLNFITDIQFIDDLWFGAGFRLNLKAKSTRTLSKTIRMTYLFDCVSMSFSMTDNFFQDRSRGVKKTKLPNFSLKLKVLNM
ncbi:MAG TPA: hypothetical protein QKA08_02210 [Candidatus Megaira endosymbiont of Nemacystus decipiens]|nr:hypothetical protein [Candidatus Megaera endosymbiont of Nemacystus decipiens]